MSSLRLARGPVLASVFTALLGAVILFATRLVDGIPYAEHGDLAASVLGGLTVVMLLFAAIGARGHTEEAKAEALSADDLVPTVAFGPNAGEMAAPLDIPMAEPAQPVKLDKAAARALKKKQAEEAKFAKQAEKEAAKAAKDAAKAAKIAAKRNKKKNGKDEAPAETDWVADIRENGPDALTPPKEPVVYDITDDAPAAPATPLVAPSAIPAAVPVAAPAGDVADFERAADFLEAAPVVEETGLATPAPMYETDSSPSWATAAYTDPEFEVPFAETALADVDQTITDAHDHVLTHTEDEAIEAAPDTVEENHGMTEEYQHAEAPEVQAVEQYDNAPVEVVEHYEAPAVEPVAEEHYESADAYAAIEEAYEASVAEEATPVYDAVVAEHTEHVEHVEHVEHAEYPVDEVAEVPAEQPEFAHSADADSMFAQMAAFLEAAQKASHAEIAAARGEVDQLRALLEDVQRRHAYELEQARVSAEAAPAVEDHARVQELIAETARLADDLAAAEEQLSQVLAAQNIMVNAASAAERQKSIARLQQVKSALAAAGTDASILAMVEQAIAEVRR